MSVDESGMPFQTFYKICKSYKDNLTNKHIYLAYRSLDTDLNGRISFEEFQNIFDVLDVSYSIVWKEQGDPNELFWWAHLAVNTKDVMCKIKDMVEHKYFEYAIDFVILANTLYVVVRAAEEHPQSDDSPNTPNKTGSIEWAFFSIYLAEMLVKLVALGYREYFSRAW